MDSTVAQDGSLPEASSQNPLRVQRHYRTLANLRLIQMLMSSCGPLGHNRSMLPEKLSLHLLIILRKRFLPHSPVLPRNPAEKEPYLQMLFAVPEIPQIVTPVLPWVLPMALARSPLLDLRHSTT